MMKITNSPSIKTQWAIAQMRELEQKGLLTSSGENEMGKPSGIEVAVVRQMILEGKNNKQIAEHYGITPISVRNFRQLHGINPAKLAPKSQTKQEEPIMSEIDAKPTQQEDMELLVKYDPKTSEGRGIDINEQQGGIRPVIITNPAEPTVGQRIDSLLALRRPTDLDDVRKSFGDLCARILAAELCL